MSAGKRMLMLKLDDVLGLLDYLGCSGEIKNAVSKLPSWPAPNPGERDGRNIMGQTEDEFWEMVDST